MCSPKKGEMQQRSFLCNCPNDTPEKIPWQVKYWYDQGGSFSMFYKGLWQKESHLKLV
jgi:hypothetical protein